ncbi:MAG TPA: alpha/beta hydrolase-fold protein, partial [Candidatus Kapabacteria bacterium]|nr:alpha/beta hydrolase-fold protein [Candidatus Kapabacteria bacterium]
MLRSLWTTTAFLVLMQTAAIAQEVVKGYYPSEYNELPYRIWGDEGDQNGPYGVVVYLHSAGESGSDNTRQIVQNTEVLDSLTTYLERIGKKCLVIVPQCKFGWKWVNTDWTQGTYDSRVAGFSTALRSVAELLSEVLERKDIDKERIYAIGVSMGGFGVWDLLHRFPSTFAAALPICGGADTNLAAEIAKTPAWVWHGAGDMVVPTQASRDIVGKLQTLKADVRYNEVVGEQHIVWPKVARESTLFDWLFSHTKEQPELTVLPLRSL